MGHLFCDLFKLTRFSFFAVFIVKSSSGGKEVYNIPVLEFKTGKMTQQTQSGNMPQNITVNMELLEQNFT